MKKTRKAAYCLALLAAVAAGCGGPAPNGWNVVLITVDTLRADHLSCSGYSRPTSPFLDGLASRGTIFRRAWSTSSWTPPAMASIFTSLHPRSHGVNRGHMDSASGKVLGQEMLLPEFPVLAAHLQKNGYATFGISANLHMTPANGFARGFKRFVSLGFAQAPAVNKAFAEMLPEIRESEPYFLWVHYFDPHDPYFARSPWIRNYSPDKKSYGRYAGKTMPVLREMLSRIRSDPEALPALRDLYDSEINYTDEHIRALVEDLPGLERTLIVITSDHGEEFLERGGIGHGSSLHEEQIRVPLILVLPDGPPRSALVEQPVSVVDIFPTVCAAAGIAAPPGLQGESLLTLAAGGTPDPERAVFAELNRARSDRRQEAVRQGKWKFVRRGGAASRGALYDLERDPGEEHNLVRAEPARAGRLEAGLEKWLAAHRPFQAPEAAQAPDEKEVRDLRSLGYLN